MLKIRTFIIVIVIYIITFISLKTNFNLDYPYELLRNSLLLPVVHLIENKSFSNSNDFNETLIKELNNEIEELKKINNIKTILPSFTKINATVIERNRNYWFNTITIDKGKKDGIDLDMAVIDANGLIGRVMRVFNNMSEIKLITTSDVNNKTSVLISENNLTNKIYGLITKYQNGYLEVTLTSKNVNLKKGMKVTTTGMGGVYPSGILIGEVVKTKNSKYDVGLIVLVKPSTDFINLKYVSVLRRNK